MAALAPFDEELPNVELPRWDWYAIGGRWDGALHLNDDDTGANIARKRDLRPGDVKTPFAMLVDGEWHEFTRNENAGWEDEFRKLFDQVRDEDWLVVVDVHTPDRVFKVHRDDLIGRLAHQVRPAEQDRQEGHLA